MGFIRSRFSPLAFMALAAALGVHAASGEPDPAEAMYEKLGMAISSHLMKLDLAAAPGRKLSLAPRRTGGLSVRSLTPWRTGILVAEEVWEPGEENMPVRLRPHWLDLRDSTLHPIRVKGVDEVLDAIAAKGEAYVLARKGKELLLLRLGEREAMVVPPPVKLEAVRLGVEGERLLLLNGSKGWGLAGGTWRSLPGFAAAWSRDSATQFFSEMAPGFPPELMGGRWVYWQARNEQNRAALPNTESGRTWNQWFEGVDFPEEMDLVLGSCWAVVPAGGGAVWMTRGDETGEHLLRVKPGKSCEIAFMYGDPAFVMPKDGLPASHAPRVTAGALLPREGGALLMFGRTGVFELAGREIRARVQLENTVQMLELDGGKGKLVWRWDPGRVLEVGRGRYVVGGTWGGVYLFTDGGKEGWTVGCLDDAVAAPLEVALAAGAGEGR